MNIVCCNKKQTKTIIYYPLKEYFNSSKLVKIDLGNPKLNFKKITNLTNNIHSNDSTPYVSIKENDTVKKIIFLRNDWGHIKKRNALRISKDSIFIDNNYLFKDFYKILSRHYNNNGNNMDYAESTEKAWVEIEIDTSDSGLELKKVISKVVKTFDKINKHHKDSLKLKIGLSYFHQIPPPSAFNEK